MFLSPVDDRVNICKLLRCVWKERGADSRPFISTWVIEAYLSCIVWLKSHNFSEKYTLKHHHSERMSFVSSFKFFQVPSSFFKMASFVRQHMPSAKSTTQNLYLRVQLAVIQTNCSLLSFFSFFEPNKLRTKWIKKSLSAQVSRFYTIAEFHSTVWSGDQHLSPHSWYVLTKSSWGFIDI